MRPMHQRQNFEVGIDPRSIPGLKIWSRADWASGVDGATFGYWFNEGETFRWFFQLTGANQPFRKYNRNGIWGTDTVQFTGSPRRMVLNGQPISGGNITVIFAGSIPKPVSGEFIFDTGADSGISRHFVQALSTGLALGRDGGGGSFVNNNFTANTFNIFSLTMDNTASSIYVNGGSVTTGTVSNNATNPTTDLRLASRFSEDAAFLSAEFNEFLLFSPRITEGQRKAVEQMLGRRYGIAVAA